MHHRTTLTCHCEERSDVAISQYPAGSQGTPGEYGNFTRRGVEDAAPYKARAVGGMPPNLQPARRSLSAATPILRRLPFNGSRYGAAVPSRDCHVGRWPPRNDKLGGITRSP